MTLRNLYNVLGVPDVLSMIVLRRSLFVQPASHHSLMTYDRFASLDQVTAKGVLEAGICLLIFGTLNARMYALVSGEDITTITIWTTESKNVLEGNGFHFLVLLFSYKAVVYHENQSVLLCRCFEVSNYSD